MLNSNFKITLVLTFFSFAGICHANFADQLRIVVPFGAGSSGDMVARHLGSALSYELNKTVLIENKPGAEGIIGSKAVAVSQPNGNTMLLTSSSMAVLDPVMRKNPSIDVIHDFTPICSVSKVAMILWLHSGLTFGSLEEFVNSARANPDKYTYSYASATQQLAAELFQQEIGIKLRGIPYRTSIAGITDTASGQIDLVFNDLVGAGAYYRAGKLKPLVVASSHRLDNLPDVPSAIDAGIPALDVSAWFALFMPVNTPNNTVKKMQKSLEKASKSSGFNSSLRKVGMSNFVICNDKLTLYQKTEIARWKNILKRANIEPH